MCSRVPFKQELRPGGLWGCKCLEKEREEGKFNRPVVSLGQILRSWAALQCFSTRVPVDLIADMTQQGAPAEEILKGYPSVTR
jgi:hypothetical protein